MGFALSSMQLTSSAFNDGTNIPQQYTGEGADISPQLSWTDAPEATKSFALICHDPDAPVISPGSYGYVHWVLYNIPFNINSLEENTDLYTSGVNDFGNLGYGGPMPPNGHGIHHYYFWLLALDLEPSLQEKLSLWELLSVVEPNVIGMNRLIAKYSRD
ncbi:MAG: YbhB/YbcL family Raf kinase inhibitor-like protein [Gammaproteobacteria bacterium TMED1]|nr:MAG: YbhB/YbcL family Raf kinase inhibitor-like protein [Gammaproteobacteria bacterium TMED1]